ncbi:hypothetical protein KY362_02505 [Candidatus Woesearchaeota archaeon]|nr:hypothetical protein [Candidatus Woesearchaeota archaeon]
MGLFHDQRLNETVRIEGESLTLDITVKNINPCRTEFSVRRGDKKSILHLSAEDGIIPLAEGVDIGVREMQQCYTRVAMHYRTLPQYKITYWS